MDAICNSQQVLAMQMCSLKYDMTMLCSIANELQWGLSILIASYLELQCKAHLLHALLSICSACAACDHDATSDTPRSVQLDACSRG